MRKHAMRNMAAVVSLLAAGCGGAALAQPTETPTFRDVTATHMPKAPEVHILDFEFADVDGDGDLDAAGAVEGGQNRLYLNDGKGVFTERANAFAARDHDSEDLHFGDLNGDGHADAIFASEDDATHELYLGRGDGSFEDVSDRLPARFVANAVEAADVDGDGHPEILMGATLNDGGSNRLWRVERDGSVTDLTDRLPAIATRTQDVKFADIDGDGDLDLVLANEVPPNRLMLNDGAGRFTDRGDLLDLVTPLETRETQLFDADGDGDADVLFCNITSNAGQWVKDPRARLLMNDGKGGLTDETARRLPIHSYSTFDCGAMDFDADGDLDLLLGAVHVPGFSPSQVRAWRNDGRGVFSDVTAAVVPASAIGRGWDFEVADLNGDGALDVMIGGWRTQARLLLGKIPQQR